MSFEAMFERAKSADGFLAALDQSGGSTPKALKLYGIPDDVSRKTGFVWLASVGLAAADESSHLP